MEGRLIPAHARNDTLISIYGKLRHDGWAPDYVETMIRSINQRHCATGPLRADELAQIVDSGRRRQPWPRQTARDFRAELRPDTPAPEAPSWLIREFVPDKDDYTTLLYGAEASGKSYAALISAFAIAMGIPLLGNRPVKQGRVGYFDVETDWWTFRYRVLAIARGIGVPISDLPGNLIYYRPRQPLKQYMDRLREIQAADALDVIFWDSFTKALSGLDLMEFGPVTDIMMKLEAIPCPIVLVDHQAGLQSALGETYRGKYPYGSRAKAWYARCLWQAERTGGDDQSMTLALYHRKPVFDRKFPDLNLRLNLLRDGNSLVRVTLEQVEGPPKPLPAVDVVMDQLWQAQGAMTIREVAQATGLHERVVREAVQKLRRSGRVVGEQGATPQSPWVYRLTDDQAD